jgi:hypothetical protein
MAKTRKPIMSPDDERFMAFEGLVQWTRCVITQAKRISLATNRLQSDMVVRDSAMRREAISALHSEHHFFSIAANKLIEYREWAVSFGLCADVDFAEINQFSAQDIKDLRNMREHVVDYFKGAGHTPARWVIETPEYKSDASSSVGSMIGGRLDWIRFAAAAERLLPALLTEPIPFPKLQGDP